MPFQNSAGFGHGPFGKGPFGHGPWVTYPVTPNFSFVEEFSQPVQVVRFEDLSEQRYLRAKKPGIELTYQHTKVSSQTAEESSSFYIAAGGPTTPFIAHNHRNNMPYVVRYA